MLSTDSSSTILSTPFSTIIYETPIRVTFLPIDSTTGIRSSTPPTTITSPFTELSSYLTTTALSNKESPTILTSTKVSSSPGKKLIASL